MQNSKKILLIITFCFAIAFSIAQQITNKNTSDKYRAVHWGLENGLSQACVYHMLKDVNGFLWIGTQGGLSRFDGSVFKNYYYDPKKSGTINAESTDGGMVEDSLHNIWIGTDKGLYRYDIKADTFTRFFQADPFWATKDELFCVESDSLISYNIHSFAKKNLATLTSFDSTGSGVTYSFFDERSNSIWMLRGYSNSYGGPPGGGLLQVSLATGKKQYYGWKCYKNISAHNHGAEAMCYDRKRNCLWINSWEGLMQFTLDDKQFHYTGALNSFFNGNDYGHWVGISLDLQGRVWLATKPKGIVIYDPSDHSVTFPFKEDTTLQNEISEYNACIYCDRDGIVWSGYWLRKGIYQLLPYSQVVKHYTADPKQPHSLSSNTVFTMVSAGQGKIWMGTTDGGLNIFDTQTGLFQVLGQRDLPGMKMNNMITPIMIDTISQKAWLLSDNNFFKTDLLTKISHPVIYKNQDNQIIPALYDYDAESYKKEIIVIGSYNNQQGIFLVNTDSNIAHQVLSFPDHSFDILLTTLVGDRLIFLRGRTDLAGNHTYANINGKWTSAPTPLDSISWNEIRYNEMDSTYWVAGERQLFHFDKDFQIIRRYTQENGLPEFKIGGIIPDNKGNIWFHADRSIHQLNIETGVITTLSEKDGFEKQDFEVLPPAEKDGSGNIYFSGGSFGIGFNQINPNKFISPSSSVYLQSLEINQKLFPLSTGVNNLQELSLRYFENKITIETGIIDYYSKGKSHIRYKLEMEGKNADWQYAPGYYTIRYENLSPAKYRLVIQASNAANEFNGPEKTLLINISPAFWNTWWFRIVAAIFVLGIFYVVIRYRTQKRFRLQLEKSERENQLALERSEKDRQMAELQQQKTEMEMQALRAQMNPHFIFNSLNSINRFILKNDRLLASEYLTKFSKLVRMILQNSQASLITLESELESLEIYINLEAVRFDHHFDYKISVPKDLDIEVLKVPPLFIQPYVENAIWHGLMHKEEKGQLAIEVSEKDDHLYFKVADNGIGRKKAAELASKSATKHKSMGLKITANRIAMLQNSNGEESPVTFNDLVHADGTAAGTEVIIKIPVIYD